VWCFCVCVVVVFGREFGRCGCGWGGAGVVWVGCFLCGFGAGWLGGGLLGVVGLVSRRVECVVCVGWFCLSYGLWVVVCCVVCLGRWG